MNMISNAPKRTRDKERKLKPWMIALIVVGVLIVVAGVLLLTVFKPSKIDGQLFFGKVETTLTATTPNAIYVLPGTVIYPNADATYTDMFGNTITKNAYDCAGVSVSVNEGAPASVSENKVTVNEDATAGCSITVTTAYNDQTFTQTYVTTYLLTETVDEKGIIKDPYRFDTLINKTRSIDSSYKSKDLVTFSGDFSGSSSVKQINKTVNNALLKLFEAAEKEDFTFYGLSGNRTWETQEGIYENEPEDSAKAGQSEHQLGFAMDLVSSNMGYLSESFGTTDEGKWLAANAHTYGFIIRYPKGKEDITGYPYEPWHVRYVGVEFATYLYTNNLTMEEFFATSNANLYTAPANVTQAATE